MWRGLVAHEKGKMQLRDYLDRVGVDKGYIIVFDFSKNKQQEWKQDKAIVDANVVELMSNIKGFDAITEYVKAQTQPGDLIITMGAGDIYKVGDMLLL